MHAQTKVSLEVFMRLTTRGRYAVTALLDIAIQAHQGQDTVSLSDIASRQSISVSYLEQLFSKLRRAALVKSIRGVSGGYQLAKDLGDISVMQIIHAVDENIDAMQCDGKGDCQNGTMCLTHNLWHGLSRHIELYLSKVSLGDLLKDNINKNDASAKIALLYAQKNNDASVSL